MAMAMALTFVLVVDVPPDSQAAFQRYEEVVLPLLSQHGGQLERRLRTADGTTEIHIVTFHSDDQFHAYVADPERCSHRVVLADIAIHERLLQMIDVEVRPEGELPPPVAVAISRIHNTSVVLSRVHRFIRIGI